MRKKLAFIFYRLILIINFLVFKICKKNFRYYLYDYLRSDSYSTVICDDFKIKLFTPSSVSKSRAERFLSKEPWTIKWIDRFDLSKKDKIIFWDIGANIGLWSKDLSSYFDRLVCFEPNPYCEDYLKKNVNLDKSKINSCALGEKNEIKNLFIHPLNSGASSFVNKTKIGFKKDSGVIYGEFPKETLQKKVEVKKLDDFNFNNIDFIKIDVQGFELSVLKGAYSTLKFNNPILCIEEDNPSNSETIPFLENLNYVVVDVIVKEHIFKKKQP